ncbi:uncharacterized protein PpBr36_10581 [Pyricularia pennisetigena]|uniref:uncharacterized protein n=1 Tax=Pyricularia pennisetigena TaxID=1578925 RepID=UPI0011516211|nr:uncharacterized protein PpBr36_10581 [Pyricularia pennisetigena]TLS21133.1 hypothetical protein PpBr36_10581 [Pyricularia pennisetigena]
MEHWPTRLLQPSKCQSHQDFPSPIISSRSSDLPLSTPDNLLFWEPADEAIFASVAAASDHTSVDTLYSLHLPVTWPSDSFGLPSLDGSSADPFQSHFPASANLTDFNTTISYQTPTSTPSALKLVDAPHQTGKPLDPMKASRSASPAVSNQHTKAANSSPLSRGLSSPEEASQQESESVVRKRERNTAAARRYRQKRLDRIKELEDELSKVTADRDELRLKLARQEAETATLRDLLTLATGKGLQRSDS